MGEGIEATTGCDRLRIEIVRKKAENPIDKDPMITWLWDALNPLFKETDGKVMVYMSDDLGPNEDQRGMVIYLEGLKSTEMRIRKIIELNPTNRNYQEEK